MAGTARELSEKNRNIRVRVLINRDLPLTRVAVLPAAIAQSSGPVTGDTSYYLV